MVIDQFEDMAKVLKYLRRNYPNTSHPEQISSEIDLPLEVVKGLCHEAELNLWVDVGTRVASGAFIKINYAGNRKLNQLTGKAESFPTGNTTIQNITAEIVNFGNDSKINSDNTTKINSDNTTKVNSDNSFYSNLSNYQRKMFILGIITIFVIIGIAMIQGYQSTMENWNGANTSESKIKDGVSGDLYIEQTLEFTIEKPDDTWYFETDLQKLRKSLELSDSPDDVLGGVFIVKTLSRDVVSVVVYKLPSESPTYLEERAERLIQYGITELNADESSIKRDFSSEGNYAFFSFEGASSKPFSLGNVAKIENAKIYEIGWVIGTTKDNYQEINDEIKCIVKSFSTTIPTINEFDLKC